MMKLLALPYTKQRRRFSLLHQLFHLLPQLLTNSLSSASSRLLLLHHPQPQVHLSLPVGHTRRPIFPLCTPIALRISQHEL